MEEGAEHVTEKLQDGYYTKVETRGAEITKRMGDNEDTNDEVIKEVLRYKIRS